MERSADISIDTKRKLGKLLDYTGECEQKLESSRQRLCKMIQFEPYASF